MRARPAFALAAAVLAVGALGACTRADAAPSAAVPTEAEVEALFEVWNDALATGDAATVAALYGDEAVLVSTLDADVKDTPQEIEAYFAESFLPKEPQGTVVESHVTLLRPDAAAVSGLYDFTVTDPATGASSLVPARFTYVYEKVDGEWLIDAHHSSRVPEAH